MEERRGGFAPIASYAALGNLRSVALVASDGRIDWLAVPTIDAPPAFAALLDPEDGGHIALSPAVPFEVSRRYVEGTAVLETTYACAGGVVEVSDSLNLSATGPLPWTELARRVKVTEGSVPLRWAVRPGHRFGSARAWCRMEQGAVRILLGDQEMGVVSEGLGNPVVGELGVEGQATLRAGESGVLVLVATDGEPLLVPAAAEAVTRAERTARAWQEWSSRIRYQGTHRDAVVRSAIVLKMLTFAGKGALAAAGTTSLPEVVGGERNFDYRFAWVRDASFALDTLSDLGLTEEVHAGASWLLAAVRRSAPDVHVFYLLSGEPAPSAMEEVEALPGYLGTAPVHVGNGAASQRQLGAYGDLLDAVWRYHRAGGRLDQGSASLVADMADRACDTWRQPDAGIWELGEYRHYTISKIGCWVAMDRAARLAEAGQLASTHVGRWRQEAAGVHSWVAEHCWSEVKESYTFAAGSDQLDASVLLAARTEFCEPGDARFASTIRALRAELGAGGPLLYRFSEMREKENAFLACTAWLVEALAYVGQVDEADELLGQLLSQCNDVGLLSEEADPATGALMGNFPQALSHLAVIGAATAVAAARGETQAP